MGANYDRCRMSPNFAGSIYPLLLTLHDDRVALMTKLDGQILHALAPSVSV